MKASELRIGNYIIQNGEITTVEKLKRSLNDWDRLNDLRSLDCIAITLTEAWLNRSELENVETRNRWIKDKFIIWKQRYLDPLSIFEQNKFYLQIVDFQGDISTLHFEIKHVHQLQNLYFDLTGKELKFEIESNE